MGIERTNICCKYLLELLIEIQRTSYNFVIIKLFNKMKLGKNKYSKNSFKETHKFTYMYLNATQIQPRTWE